MEHKMKEIVQEAKKIMRHSKRDFLTTQDVKLAMRKLNVSDVFGYPSHMQAQYQRVQVHLGEGADGNPGNEGKNPGAASQQPPIFDQTQGTQARGE